MNSDHTHFLAISKLVIDHLTDSLGYRTHSDNDILGIFSSVINERTIGTTGNLGHFIHITSHNIRNCIVELVSRLSPLEIHIRILSGSLCYRVLRILSPITELLQSLHVNQATNIFHIQLFDLLDLVRSTETVKEINERNS